MSRAHDALVSSATFDAGACTTEWRDVDLDAENGSVVYGIAAGFCFTWPEDGDHDVCEPMGDCGTPICSEMWRECERDGTQFCWASAVGAIVVF